jgi:hypothetical protein
MKTGEAVNQRLATLLAEARTVLDTVRQQQRETGDFKEADRMALVAKLAHITGFFDALETGGYSEMPTDLAEQWGTLREDTRDARYVSERPTVTFDKPVGRLA